MIKSFAALLLPENYMDRGTDADTNCPQPSADIKVGSLTGGFSLPKRVDITHLLHTSYHCLSRAAHSSRQAGIVDAAVDVIKT